MLKGFLMKTFTLTRGRLVAALALTLTVALTPLSTGAAFAQEAPAPSRQHFDPALNGHLGGCIDEPPADQRVSPTLLDGSQPSGGSGVGWQTSAPRYWLGQRTPPTRPGETAALGLRDKFGTGNRLVLTDVYGPDGQQHGSGRWLLVADNFGYVTYPWHFFGAPPLENGTYTVIWRDADSGGYIACDGFFVAS
jgi:hypothetical protein